MKTFIVSLGILLFGIGGLTFNWDMNSYIILKTNLKFLCESCAAYGAVCFQESSFQNQNIIEFNDDDVLYDLNYFLLRASENMPCFNRGTLSIDELNCNSNTDSVSVTIKFVSDEDMFRIPFLEVLSIQHSSCYEWISFEEK